MTGQIYHITIHGATRGSKVTIHGVEHGKAKLVTANEDAIVVHFAGFSYNPGSPHSGFKSYSPVCHRVFARNDDGTFTALIDW